MVNIVIGAHRMRQRVDNAQEAAHECIRSRVLRPDHIHHRIVVFWVGVGLTQVFGGQFEGLKRYGIGKRMIYIRGITF